MGSNGHSTRLGLLTLIALAPPVVGSASSDNSSAHKTVAVKPSWTRVTIDPPSVTFNDRREQRHLLVTGQDARGTLHDLTRSARYRATQPAIANVNENGILTPGEPGQAEIVVTVDNVVTKVPVTVPQRSSSPVNFTLEVVPALTRSRCNMGACHGTPSGKNGFRLSLQGYLPDQDYSVLTRETYGRRTNPLEPEESLILKKGLAEIPHEGGKKLWKTEDAYRVIEQWVAEGCLKTPENTPSLVRLEILPGARSLRDDSKQQQVVVIAHFSEGPPRDVTSLVTFSVSDEQTATVTKSGLVTFSRRGSVAVLCRYLHQVSNARLSYVKSVPGFAWKNPPIANEIDRLVYEKLKELQIEPSGQCTDEEFVRRVYLDAVGALPTVETVTTFLADKSPGKRDRLIDRVLASPSYADFWALKWADVLRNSRKQVAYRGAFQYRRYLVDVFAQNRPFDQFVTELLTSRGDTLSSPAANFYRVAREPLDCAESTSQLFLGVRMQCAKCHNHPFERWTQDDYYGFAAFFARVKHKKPSADAEREVVFVAKDGEVNHLRTGKVMLPKAPGVTAYAMSPGEDRRTYLAQWLTSADNPFFARSIVNRIWFHLLGKGIVDPVDDFRDSNPPTNEELLAYLAKEFVQSGFDHRHMVRLILRSNVYQASARSTPLNADDEKHFSRAYTRMLSAEPLLDALCDATECPENYAGLPPNSRAVQLPDADVNHPFLQAFGQPTRELVCECARESESTLNQALNLINGDVIHAKLRHPDNRIGRLLKANQTNPQIITELYLATLSRPPADDEIKGAERHIQKTGDRRRALEDIHWALLNCKEFLFRH